MTHDSVQTVYFVGRVQATRGEIEGAQPVVLVDAGLEHRYADIVHLEVVDDPGPENVSGAIPVFTIDPRELSLYRQARFAAIVQDRRLADRAGYSRRSSSSNTAWA